MGQGVMLFPRASHFWSKGMNKNFTWFITYIKIALPCIFASIRNKTKSNCQYLLQKIPPQNIVQVRRKRFLYIPCPIRASCVFNLSSINARSPSQHNGPDILFSNMISHSQKLKSYRSTGLLTGSNKACRNSESYSSLRYSFQFIINECS